MPESGADAPNSIPEQLEKSSLPNLVLDPSLAKAPYNVNVNNERLREILSDFSLTGEDVTSIILSRRIKHPRGVLGTFKLGSKELTLACDSLWRLQRSGIDRFFEKAPEKRLRHELQHAADLKTGQTTVKKTTAAYIIRHLLSSLTGISVGWASVAVSNKPVLTGVMYGLAVKVQSSAFLYLLRPTEIRARMAARETSVSTIPVIELTPKI